LQKTEIRKMAADRGFTDLLNKSESYEICFVPDNDYRGFLKRHDTTLEERVAGGDFVLRDGTVIGKHEGYPFYTIGQRKGLGVALGFPAYVVDIQKESNQVVLGPIDHMHKDSMRVSRLNYMKYADIPQEGIPCIAKIRYNHEGTPAKLVPAGPDVLELYFDEPVFAIAPGQSAVFYEGNDVIAGGWIMKAWNR
jgi:tRNA-specific 2-thiouridylase